MLQEGQPDVVLFGISSNDINNQTKNKINTENLKEDIINIGKPCINLCVKGVIISSILLNNDTA